MKRIYLKPAIKTVRMCPHTILAVSTNGTNYGMEIGDDDNYTIENGGTGPSRWFDDSWDNDE